MKTNALAKWFNAIADAWGRGEAWWAYREDGTSLAVYFWVKCREHHTEEETDMKFVDWCIDKGITLKRIK